jgi:penicillin-binding protein 1A
MAGPRKRRALVYTLVGVAVFLAIGVGVTTGIGIAAVWNTPDVDVYGTPDPALPSRVLDRDGELITEFFSEQNREVVTIDELPKHLIYALITREDRNFFDHNGFSFKGTARAAWNLLRNNYISGGSTITQQLAGHLYADRSKITVGRKLRELWWALQLERQWTKYEILERYLNTMYFGHGNYGVEAASQFYFGHSARDLSVAESVMLVIQLANPSLYSPIKRPNNAQEMQRRILDQMVKLGYVTQNEVDTAFQRYWNNYDYTRSASSSAALERKDKAPYFSEYVRGKLQNEYLLGSYDIYRDGFTIHTTLDLDYQDAAREHLREGIQTANEVYHENTKRRVNYGNEIVPLIDLLALGFDLPGMHVGDAKQRQQARSAFMDEMSPLLDAVSLMLGAGEGSDLRRIAQASYSRIKQQAQRTTVQGALVTVENDTGHILSMVGGNRFEANNQFNRATQARVEPGSSFKPLYYSAAIEEKAITPATMIYDAPVVFWNDDGSPYTPKNYKGAWNGPVLARQALANSMNVPSLRVLSRVGFEDALSTARKLLGIPKDEMVSRNLVRRWPVGLGIVEVAPIEMAKAYSTIANGGNEVVPIAVRYIEDRNGRIIAEPEQQLRLEQQKKGEETQVLSPQTAYIMTDMLKTTVQTGTLSYARQLVDDFKMPTAGKTGTTQNWADAWTVGFTPYYTTAIWLGFDQGGGNSLGTNQTGAVTTGPVWARYMEAIHEGLEPRKFDKPATGLTETTVTAKSGLLPPEDYQGETVEEVFLEGTAPETFDTWQDYRNDQESLLVNRLEQTIQEERYSLDTSELSQADEGELDLDLKLDVDLSQFQGELDSPDGSSQQGNPLLD